MLKIFIISISFLIMGCSSNESNSSQPEIRTDSNITVTTKDDNDNSEKEETQISDINSSDLNQSQDKDKNDEKVDEVNLDGNTIISGGYEDFEKDTNMRIGKIYTVSQGDNLIEIDNAKVKITKNSEKSFAEIILLSGKAKIVWSQK